MSTYQLFRGRIARNTLAISIVAAVILFMCTDTLVAEEIPNLAAWADSGRWRWEVVK